MDNHLLNQKITQALERISKAFRVLLWEESKLHKISPIQIQLILFCASHKKEELTVSFFAKEFDLTKATISDSVKVLLKKGLLNKSIDPTDTRSYTVQLTSKGKEIADKTIGFSTALNQSIDMLSNENKGVFLNQLLSIIQGLNQQEVISIQRMCLTCYHYQKNENSHYCNLLDKPLKNRELQIDCEDHQVLEN